MMTPKERTAMQQALEALEELFQSNSTKIAVEKYDMAYNALQEALDQPDEIDWIETNKALANEIIELQKQAEQEPVADYAYQSIEEYEDLCGMQVNDAFKIGWDMARTTNAMLGIKATPVEPVKQEPVATMEVFSGWGDEANFEQLPFDLTDGVYKLYAAPVRTKDLTDDEIVKVTGCEKDRPLWLTVSSIARAVIAADREKNK